LVVGSSITEIAVRSASHRRFASEEAAHLALLSSVSAQALRPGPADDVIERVRAEIAGMLADQVAAVMARRG